MVEQGLSVSASIEETLSMRGLKLIKKVGEGSYAKVFLAITKTHDAKHGETKQTESKNQTTLACKIVDAAKAPKDFIKKFLPRELDILLKLNHPHIVHIHSIFQRRMKYFILMRYAEKGDLLQYILKHGQLPENQARVWARQIALAVQYLHEMNIAHRDLKCENVLITANQNTKLSDFGFSRFVVDAKKKPILSNTYCGSLSYAAPEVLRGTPYVPRGADIWSFGILLYVMINKSMPFDDSNIRKLYELQMKRKWKFRAKVVGLSEQCKKLVTMMMEPEVGSRFSIDQVVHSEWIAMDSRLANLSPMESAAYEKAKEDKNTTDYSDKNADAIDSAVERRFNDQGKTEPRLSYKSRSRSPQPYTSKPHSTRPRSTRPRSSVRRSTKPHLTNKRSPETHSPETHSPEPHSPEPHSPEPQSPEPQSTGPRSSVRRPTKPYLTERSLSNSRSNENHSPETLSPRSQSPQPHSSKKTPPDNRPTEHRKSERRASKYLPHKPNSSKQRSPEAHSSKKTPSELHLAEPHKSKPRSSKYQSPESYSNETQSSERHPSKHRPSKYHPPAHISLNPSSIERHLALRRPSKPSEKPVPDQSSLDSSDRKLSI